MEEPSSNKSHLVYDPIYGFIKLTPVEWEIIQTPFYQRLRWIKQLGFSFYVFPGAEHSRYGHSIGVMNNADKILSSIGRAVSWDELIKVKGRSKEALYHQSLRIGALLHDLGTFPFSHTIEGAYISYGETTRLKGGKGLADDHENLGSFIIKNTLKDGGITATLEKYDLNPQMISDLVKGVDPSVLANQILHSEIDCDRMDYLLRDAHYTGLRYGTYDRDYLLHHFEVKRVEKHDILTINQNALHCVEDFLMSRYAWYSQVIRSPRGAKYDAIAENICFFMLKKGKVSRYSDLLEMVEKDPLAFFRFSDSYFMENVYQCLRDGTFDKDPDIKGMAEAILLKGGAVGLQCPEFRQRLVSQDDPAEKERIVKKAQGKLDEIKHYLDKNGAPGDWLIGDLPKKPILFVRSYDNIVKSNITKTNLLLERDPVKISYDNGDVRLLAEVENSVMSRVGNADNYIPNVYCSQSAYLKLLSAGMVDEL